MNKSPTNSTNGRTAKDEQVGVEELYLRFFSPARTSVHISGDDNISLDQPWPLKFLPSETTYGVESIVGSECNG
jgi:hypothetical protein